MSDDAADASGVGTRGALRVLRRSPIELAGIGALGALQTIAFVDGDLWPLQLIAIALLAWRVGESSPRRAAALGFVFGVGWLCAGTWWLYVSMHRYGGLAAWLAALAVLALAAFLSLYLAAAMALVACVRPRSRGRAALLFAAVWLLAELARGIVLT
ncbi:MAG: apolipoprotein N-acyltransferase, partial [Pseudomonadota bacterium]|nr:apolipoprotein N-acyltransferase [Pseudomonadota bacterium]